MKKLLLVLSVLVLSSTSSYAEETISLYADICEKMEPEETVSQVRTRAADKAVFSAVERLPVLELPRKEFDQHDFNILVYKLVDNYIENLNVRTIKQDAQKVCIEVDGYIKGSNIITAVLETKEIVDKRTARRAQENLSGSSPLKTQKEIESIIMKEAAISPLDKTVVEDNKTIVESPNVQGKIIKMPKPDENELETVQEDDDEEYIEDKNAESTENSNFLSEEIVSKFENTVTPSEKMINDAFEQSTKQKENIQELKNFGEEIKTSPNQKVIVQDSDTIIIVNEEDGEDAKKNSIDSEEKTSAFDTPKGKVYIAATKFFDSTTSQEHSAFLKNLFSGNDYFDITDNKELADYVVTPNILRVKIDSINNITNRMQMVIMIELEDIRNNVNIKEHQNRFTLLSVEDDEQKIAQDLMNKLLEKASSQILNKIEITERKQNKIKSLPKIITPASNQPLQNAQISAQQ